MNKRKEWFEFVITDRDGEIVTVARVRSPGLAYRVYMLLKEIYGDNVTYKENIK